MPLPTLETTRYSVDDGIATITLNRPERKNPLTFDSYAELRDWFLGLQRATDIKAVVVTGAGGNFCSGGDVHEIIGPLTQMTMPELLAFTRMTGALVSAMRACPQPIVAALDGVCAGAGAMMALAADLRSARNKRLAIPVVLVVLGAVAGVPLAVLTLYPWLAAVPLLAFGWLGWRWAHASWRAMRRQALVSMERLLDRLEYPEKPSPARALIDGLTKGLLPPK